MNQSHFDERNWESWYFGEISHEEVENLLEKEAVGSFLLRASTSVPDTFVICVKEKSGVANYPIKTGKEYGKVVLKVRDDSSFSDMPSLLSFYKRNLFQTTSLIRPITNVMKRKDGIVGDALIKRYSENLSASGIGLNNSRGARMSAPADSRIRLSREEGMPLYVKVIKPRVPSPYEESALKLRVGDVIRVLRRSRDQWEGELNGEKGYFPFTYVEFVEPPNSRGTGT